MISLKNRLIPVGFPLIFYNFKNPSLTARIFYFFRSMWSDFLHFRKFDKISKIEKHNIKRSKRLFLITNSKARLKKEWLESLYIDNLRYV